MPRSPGDTAEAFLDYGTFLVTERRAVFTGPKHTREWAFAKMQGYAHDDQAPWTSIAVSNRQRSSGVLYDEGSAGEFRRRFDLAVAVHLGTTDALAESVRQRIAELEVPPAGWYPDAGSPGRLRWWDGAAWTDNHA